MLFNAINANWGNALPDQPMILLLTGWIFDFGQMLSDRLVMRPGCKECGQRIVLGGKILVLLNPCASPQPAKYIGCAFALKCRHTLRQMQIRKAARISRWFRLGACCLPTEAVILVGTRADYGIVDSTKNGETTLDEYFFNWLAPYGRGRQVLRHAGTHCESRKLVLTSPMLQMAWQGWKASCFTSTVLDMLYWTLLPGLQAQV